MPTQHNSPIFAGHRPSLDAAPVATLRAAGAIILGKTDTTEFAAAGRWAATRHPLDPRHSPGGSSAGSAAAVADAQVPLALGTQTAGSTMRPASFCGVFAFKPTWGAVSREGLKLYAASLDTLTWFARSVADLNLLAEVFAIADDAPPVPVPVRGARIGLCRSPAWSFAQPGTETAMDAAAARLRAAGAVVTMLDLPESFADLGFGVHQAVMFSEGRAAFLNLARTHPDLLHDDFHARVENRAGISRARLAAAYDQAAACRAAFDAIARDYDAILTPSARGEAPLLEAGPGDAVFNRMWTLLHVPCVGIPVCAGPGGLPVGVTLVGPRFADRQLRVTAQAVAEAMAPDSP
jgi:Asp-tRNA(Asn)/Glu-tRNA(Gln) amidotransferase A subunit family amidase